MKLTNRERIMRIFNKKPVDRPAVKLWGLEPGQQLLHPDYQPIYDLAVQKTDLFVPAGSPFDFLWGNSSLFYESTNSPDSVAWTRKEEIIHTPEGDLSSISLVSNEGKPGYVMTHYIKEPADIKKLFSISYEPCPISLDNYHARKQALGDSGIVWFALDHPGYAMQRLMGSELLAFFSVDERELLRELIDVFARRLRQHVEKALDAGLKDEVKKGGFVMGWVGPELLIPPLLSYIDFEEFCFNVDKPLMDTIHEAGGNIWIHCHGKVGKLIRRFAAMGCDVLNPIEPPPMGDITFDEAFKEAGGQVSLEGNIEIGRIMESPEAELKELIEDSVKTGMRHAPFILCPSAGYMEVPDPPRIYIENLLTYVQFGLECAEKYSQE
jgi:uroporphyrinogen-III decarboxylase